MDSLLAGIGGFILGVICLTAVLAVFTTPKAMEECAEVFCSKDGQGLLKYEAEVWDFKNITCGGAPDNDVIKRNYKSEEIKTYDIFTD